jgi:hypothetical protein
MASSCRYEIRLLRVPRVNLGEEDWKVDSGSHVGESITFLSCLEQPEQKCRIRQLPGDTNPSDILKVRQWMSDNRVGVKVIHLWVQRMTVCTIMCIMGVTVGL